jgi:hypothetical protein
LPEPNKYTGHCWRRTAATHIADAGCSLTVLKQATGHLSDKVAQQYIDRSEVMVDQVASAIAIRGEQVSAIEARKKRSASSTDSSQPEKKMATTPAAATYNISFSGANISAPIRLFAHDNKDEDLFRVAMQKVQYLDAALEDDSDVPFSEIFVRRKEARDALKNLLKSNSDA